MRRLEERCGAGHTVRAATLSGNISEERLSDALNVLQSRHPLLDSRIELTSTSGPRFVRHAADKIPITLVDWPDVPGSERALLETELNRPILETDPALARLTAVRARDGWYLLVTCHHAIADGVSMTYLIRELCQACTGRPLEPRALGLLPPVENLFPQPFLNPVSRGQLIDEFVSRQLQPGSDSSSWPQSAHGERSRLVIRDLRDAPVLLAQRAAQEGSSFHAMLCATLLGAASDIANASVAEIATTVDLRSRVASMSALEGLGAYFSGVRLAASGARTTWEAARKLQRALREALRCGDPFATVFLQEAAIDALGSGIFLAPPVAITNLGRLSFPINSEVAVQSTRGAVPMHGLGSTIGVHALTFRHQLQLSFSANESTFSGALLESYACAVSDRLRSLVQ